MRVSIVHERCWQLTLNEMNVLLTLQTAYEDLFYVVCERLFLVLSVDSGLIVARGQEMWLFSLAETNFYSEIIKCLQARSHFVQKVLLSLQNGFCGS